MHHLHVMFIHLSQASVSEMTYNVSSGTLNPTIQAFLNVTFRTAVQQFVRFQLTSRITRFSAIAELLLSLFLQN